MTIDVQKQLLEDLYQIKRDTSVLLSKTMKNSSKSNQAEIVIIGMEKDRTIYQNIFLKYRFIQLKKQKQLMSENLESWVGFDESKGDLIQVCLFLCRTKTGRNAIINLSDGYINKVINEYATASSFSFKGPLIALIGSDGSGKSTVTTDLEKWFSEKIDCRRYYLGSGDHYNPVYKRVIKMMIRRFRLSRALNEQQMIKTGKSQVNQIQENILKKGLKSCFCHVNAFYLYRISVHSLKQLKKSKGFSASGGICLFDRYPQNQFVGINDGPKIRKAYGRLNSSLINRLIQMEEENINRCVKMSPDLVIKLIVSPEVAILRKPDHNILELEKKTDIICKLDFENAAIHNIDANQKYEEELKVIKKLIWDYLFRLLKMNG